MTVWVRYRPHSAQNFAAVVSSMVLEPSFFDIFLTFFQFGCFRPWLREALIKFWGPWGPGAPKKGFSGVSRC